MNTSEFELKIYSKKLNKFEKKQKLTKIDLNEIKSMQQIVSEGYRYYPKQYSIMNKDKILERLNKLLKNNSAKKLGKYEEMPQKTPDFENHEIVLEDFCDNLKIKTQKNLAKYPKILKELCDYTFWATKEKAFYIFLLRDMFLPYLITKNVLQKPCYPMLYGRKILKYFYSNSSIQGFDFGESDDDPIYLKFLYTLCDVASNYNDNFDKFFKVLKPKFLKLIKQNKSFFEYTKKMLSKIKSEKIIIIECGRYGTIPLILKCLDERIDFKLFSTGPEMFELYKDRIYNKKGLRLPLSKLVDMEKLTCQNEMFIFSSIKNDKVMIKVTTNKKLLEQSHNEIACALKISQNIFNKRKNYDHNKK